MALCLIQIPMNVKNNEAAINILNLKLDVAFFVDKISAYEAIKKVAIKTSFQITAKVPKITGIEM